MRHWTLALLVILVMNVPSPSGGIEVEANPRGNGLVLKDHELRRPHESDKSSNGTRSGMKPRHPCTFSVTFVVCSYPDGGPAAVGGAFTPGMAREAVANIPLPGLALHVQPDGETLVNVPTIFWVEPEEFSTTITLLGHEIEVEATPEHYTWVHGDGTAQSTSTPGKPYPSLDITHRYGQPVHRNARVDTTYTVRYSIDGGDWSDLGEALTARGPSTVIDVHEAAPVLSSR